MSTPAQPLSTQQPSPPPFPEFGQHTSATLAARIRTAYPDGVASDGMAYKDIPDDEMASRLIEKHPVYQQWLKTEELQRLSQGTPQDTGVWNAVKRVASNVAKMPGQVYDAATKPWQPGELEAALPKDITAQEKQQQLANAQQDEQSWIGKAASAIPKVYNRMIAQPSAAEQAKVTQSFEKNSPFEAVGHQVAAAVPLIGPWAANVGERIGSGDVSGGLTEAGTVFAGPELAKKGIELSKSTVAPVLSRVAQSAPVKAVTEIPKRAVEPLGVGVPGERMVKQGLSPYAKQTGFDNALKTAANDIVDYHKDTPIKTVRDLDEALPKIKDDIQENEFKPVMERNGKTEFTPERAARVKQAVLDSVSPFAEEFEPGTQKEIADLAQKMGKTRTIGEIMGGPRGGLLGYINGKLETYFNKYPSARRGDLMKNPDTAAWEAARRTLRNEALDQLEENGETDIRSARQRWGAVDELQKATERRINQGDRLKPVGLGKALGLAFAPKTMGVSYILGAIGDFLNKPDTLVGRGISKMAEEPRAVTPAPARPITRRVAPAERTLQTGPGGSPPAVPGVFRTELTGTAEGPTELGRRGGKGVFAPKRLLAPKEISTTPPTVTEGYRMEPIGEPTESDKLGLRGKGGVRQPGVKGLLPGPKETGSPAVPLQHRVEAIGTVAGATKLGPRGAGGVITTPKGLLPAPSEAAQQSNVPPAVNHAFAREAIGTTRQAVRTGAGPVESPHRPIKGELPAPAKKPPAGMTKKKIYDR